MMNEKIFKSRYVKTAGCWLWIGKINIDGYGVYADQRAHRVSFEKFKGPVPLGLEIDHLCSVRNCVNPSHLEAVTHKENVRRGNLGAVTRARQMGKTHCPQGHEYNEINTYIAPKTYLQNGEVTRTPARHCRICKKAAHKKWTLKCKN